MAGQIIVVSGLPDLVTAIAALQQYGISLDELRSRALVLLLGDQISLPDDLCASFSRVAPQAFGFQHLGVHRWQDGQPALDLIVAPFVGAELAAANHLQAKPHRDFLTRIQPRQFVFFDNGLSSYADHRFDMPRWLDGMPLDKSATAYLTHLHRFGVPAYLAGLRCESIPAPLLRTAAEAIGLTCLDPAERLGAGDAVILGTSFSRSRLISVEDERAAHALLWREVSRRHPGRICFKAHPRAIVPMFEDPTIVRELDKALPLEAFVSEGGGAAYSFSSTCLFTLEDQFGWASYRASHPALDMVLDARMQLAKMDTMQVSVALEGDT